MASETLGYIFNAIAQTLQPEMVRQWNRTTVLLGELTATKAAIQEGAGKNTQFAAEFSGATAATVAEGSDVASGEFASDLNVPMTAPWCTYRSSFQLSELEVDAVRGAVGSPDELRALFAPRMLSAGAVIARQIETDLLTGTGVDSSGNPTLIGVFGGALAASGTYLGLNAATYPEWAGNVTSNGGTARSLTSDLLDQCDQNVFTASSEPWNLIMTSAGVVRKYNGLFTNSTAPMIRFNDNAQSVQMGLGGAITDQGQQENIWYRGKRVLRNAVAPTGKLALLNTNYIKLRYLPRYVNSVEQEFIDRFNLKGQSGTSGPVQATSIPCRVTVLAKTGDSIKVTMKAVVAAAITRRNSMALLTDLSEV